MTSPNSSFGSLTEDIIRRSIHQNEILFTSEGLTLLSLDHVYQFKTSLSKYSRLVKSHGSSASNDIISSSRLKEEALNDALQGATDALHRLVLAQGGKRISKGYLLRAYDHLPVTWQSMVTVNCNYQVCYGGVNFDSGIAMSDGKVSSPRPEMSSKTTSLQPQSQSQSQSQSTFTTTPTTPTTTITSKPPAATTTAFHLKDIESIRRTKSPRKQSIANAANAAARSPSSNPPPSTAVPSLNTKLSALPALVTEKEEKRMGPVTPNGFEDITPVTRGEWCFLMVGEGWKGPAGVEVLS